MKINEIQSELSPGEKRLFTPSNTITSRSWDKFLSDCSDSIASIKSAGQFLYRGIKQSNPVVPDIFIGRSRNDRLPLLRTRLV